MISASLCIKLGPNFLADGSAAGGICEALSINGTAVLQIEDIVRSLNPVGFDRGNERNELTARISTQYGTNAQAIDAWLRCRQLTPHIGNLHILFTPDGITTSEWSSDGALWPSVKPALNGNSVIVEYQITALNDFTSSNVVGANPFDMNISDQGDFDGGNAVDTIFAATLDFN